MSCPRCGKTSVHTCLVSSEAEKMAREYAEGLHRLGTITKTESYVAERAHYDGYPAGQQSLWRDPSELPETEKQHLVLCRDEAGNEYPDLLWFYQRDDEPPYWYEARGDVIGWMPIVLPATKEGAE